MHRVNGLPLRYDSFSFILKDEGCTEWVYTCDSGEKYGGLIILKEFKNFHPFVNFIYFLFVIGFLMLYMNPVCLLISFFCALIHLFYIKKKVIKSFFTFMLPAALIPALVNTLFNHRGMTILWHFPSGNPLTLESIVYGLFAAAMLIGAINWFTSFGEVMTSDKIHYLFGKAAPSIGLIFSMTLRFVPLFISKFKEVIKYQKVFGKSVYEGKLIQRLKNILTAFSLVTTYALENSVDTADSMKGRGFGIKKRTFYSIFIFSKRDIYSLIIILILSGIIIAGSAYGCLDYSYFPALDKINFSPFSLAVYTSYFLLCIYPVFQGGNKKWSL